MKKQVMILMKRLNSLENIGELIKRVKQKISEQRKAKTRNP
jgi:hypothetical protein